MAEAVHGQTRVIHDPCHHVYRVVSPLVFQSLRPERAALAAGSCVRPVRPADRRARSAGGHQECLSTIGSSFSRTPEKEMSMIQCPVGN